MPDYNKIRCEKQFSLINEQKTLPTIIEWNFLWLKDTTKWCLRGILDEKSFNLFSLFWTKQKPLTTSTTDFQTANEKNGKTFSQALRHGRKLDLSTDLSSTIRSNDWQQQKWVKIKQNSHLSALDETYRVERSERKIES